MNLEWSFLRWTVVPKLGDYEDLVTEVTWQLTATEGEFNTWVTGTVKFPPPDGDVPTVQKAEITKDMLIEWVKPFMGYDAYVVNLQTRLAEMASNTTVEVPVLK